MSDMSARPKRVLVCYDGAEVAERALDAAVGFMGYGSTLAVASVAQDGSETANSVLSDARQRLLQRHLTATYLPLLGDPVEELVDAARYLEADLVVVGRRSHDGATRSSLGSVSGDIVRRAPCDVLVVR